MTQILLVVAVALTVGATVFGITVLVTGDDEGLRPTEPDGRAVPLPADRPLAEPDLTRVRFDTALRGYRMAQVDVALRRAAYDIGYKDELIKVLQSEIDALRDGRFPDAEVMRRAREAALAAIPPAGQVAPAGQVPPAGPEAAEADPGEPAEPAGAEPGEPAAGDPGEPAGTDAGDTSVSGRR